MERLTKEANNGMLAWYTKNNSGLPEYVAKTNPYREICEKLKAYEDLEEQGRLLILPCAVGDTLWWIDAYGDVRSSKAISMFIEQGIDGVVIETEVCNVSEKDIGKTVFLTEAEQEKMKGE